MESETHEAAGLELELEQAQLILKNRVLEKRANKKLVAHHELCDITKIEVIRKIETVNVAIALGAFALTGLCYANIDHLAVRWAVVIVLGIFALLMAATAQQMYLELHCGADVARYVLSDPAENAEGFVMSLKQEWEQARREAKKS